MPSSDRRAGERGSAVVEFALVAPLLLAVALGVLSLVLTLIVRSTLASAAAEGARAASLAGALPGAGVVRAGELVRGSLADGSVEDITAGAARVDGVEVMVVTISYRLPLVGLILPTTLTVDGRALREGWA